jgi:hypothetical protein
MWHALYVNIYTHTYMFIHTRKNEYIDIHILEYIQ